MNKYCFSCGIPVGEEAQGNYCQNCTDEAGNLRPKAEVQQGIARWLAGFSPAEGQVDFLKRAEKYLEAMPAWND